MKIIFAGTPEFALPALRELLCSHHKICAIYTQPDRKAGRGQKLTASPVKDFAVLNNLQVCQPLSLKDQSAQKELQEFAADVLVNVAYGMILPQEVLKIPKFGCVNIHPSLLPRWRGAAPIQRAILAGDKITGVTIMQMDEGLDTGAIYKQIVLPIGNTETTETLMEKAAKMGADLLLDVLAEIENGTATVTKQNDEYATYAKKIVKEEAAIDWCKSADEIDCMIRAFNPWPIAYTVIDEQAIRIWAAEVVAGKSNCEPGVIIQANKNGIDVATGEKILRLLKLQLPGGKQLPISAILNAYEKIFFVGKKFKILK